jgi:hypothetical protein
MYNCKAASGRIPSEACHRFNRVQVFIVLHSDVSLLNTFKLVSAFKMSSGFYFKSKTGNIIYIFVDTYEQYSFDSVVHMLHQCKMKPELVK